MLHQIPSAPASALPSERRGAVVGRFCKACSAVYARHAARHVGKPARGRDHVAAPCAYEGRAFGEEASWWEPAVEVLPASQSAPGDAA